MNTRHRLLVSIVATAVSVLAARPAVAEIESFTESFTTTQHKDEANTTAIWDTVAGEIRLHEYDVQLLATYDTPGVAVKVSVAGNLAFVGDHANSFRIIDIENPAAPTLVGSFDVGAPAFGAVADGKYLFVACWTLGLKVFDISNPAAPVQIGWYNTAGYAKDLVVAGDYVYLADGTDFVMIDVSDPTNPVAPYGYATPGAVDVAVDGRHAYVADSSAGLLVFNLVYPQSLVATLAMPSPGRSVAVDGDVAYVGGQDGLYAVDVADPANPVLMGTFGGSLVNCEDVAVEGGIAYAAFRTDGLQLVDVRDPANMALLGSYNTPSDAYGVALDGTHALVADYTAGLHVLQVAQPLDPPVVGNTVSGASFSNEAEVRGHHAYSGRGGQLVVFDISDPDTLVEVANTPGFSTVLSLGVAGDYAYTTDQFRLGVFNIADPTTPYGVASVSLPSTGWDMTIYGNYVFVATPPAGLVCVSIEDPTSPSIVSTYDYGGSASAVAVSGNYAYVGDPPSNLRVIDISNPVTPSLVNTLPAGYVRDLEIAGNYLFVAQDGGFRIRDISDPANPVSVGQYVMTGPSGVHSIEIVGDYAFLATTSGGMIIVDIAVPSAPGPAVLVPGVDEPYAVAVSGRYAYCFNRWDATPVRVFAPLFDTAANVAQSIGAVSFSPPRPRWVRFTTTQVDSIAWQASINGGTSWTDVTPGEWTYTSSVYNLSWRATLVQKTPGYNPSCQSLRIEWLYDMPIINAIVDVPNDEGRQVRIAWQKAGYDAVIGSNPPITGYAIYRRIGTGLAAASQLSGEARGPTASPPGTWDYIKTVPARTDDYYSTFVPTLVDSTASGGNYYSVFFVRALTTVSYAYVDSPVDSGWSVDNLSPHPPSGFLVAYGGGSNALEWDPSTAPDFDHFEIHRAMSPDFEPGPDTYIHGTTATSWQDPTGTTSHYYRLIAVDDAGNQSEPASPQTTTGVPQGSTPLSFALYQNVPNPFNPSTTIRFDVPSGGGRVTVDVFDVGGRHITTLLDGFVQEGRKSVTWRGKDWRGRPVASGVYFVRFAAPGYEKTIKLTLVQ